MRFLEYDRYGEATAQQEAAGSVQENRCDSQKSIIHKQTKGSSICVRKDMREVRVMRAMYGVSDFCISTLGAPDYIDTESGSLLETCCFGNFGVKSHESFTRVFAAKVCGS